SVSINDSTWLDKALERCINENLYSANDFKDVVLYLKKQSQQETLVSLEQEKRPIHKVDIPVGTRPLSTYTSILGGELS
ncbi:IS21 family transposase, partial [Psychrobacillus sp. MER TA 171]|nr:IS21 family transposase [Psychrobacillus sp. MER TA 171]